MTIKFKMDTREKAYEAKYAIIDLAEMCDFVTVEDVKHLAGYSDNYILPEDKTLGWRWSDLKGNNIFVRMCKYGEKEAQPYLFLCDPPIKVTDLATYDFSKNSISSDEMAKLEIAGSKKTEDDIFFDKLYELCVDLLAMMAVNNDGRRKCMVWKKSKKKNVVAEEWPCWFHCWSSNRVVKDDGMVVDQLLAVCEYQDGHVERINFDHIRFVDEWE